MRLALVYDRVNKWGGAERVLLTLHEIWPQAPLYTAVYNPEKASWTSVFEVKPSFIQHLPYLSAVCRKNSLRFSKEIFKKKMEMRVENLVNSVNNSTIKVSDPLHL